MPVTTRLRAKLEKESWRASRNPCTLHNFLIIMKEQAGKDELYNLRQLSTQYNRILSSTYFDLAEKCAVIESSDDAEEPRNYLYKVSKELPHIYRRLQIRSLGCMDSEAVKDFLRIVGPNIKGVCIRPPRTITRGYILPILQELLNLNSFGNITSLNLKFDFNEFTDDTTRTRNLLAQFPQMTRIRIYRLYAVFANDFIRVSEILDSLKNVEFYGKFLILRIQEIAPFEQFFTSTNKWLYDSKYAFKHVFFVERTPANIGNVVNMIRSLDFVLGLSKCNTLIFTRFRYEYNWKFSEIPNLSCWKQNIKELHLIALCEPLLGLRDFPNLKKLHLNGIECLLSNVALSDEDNLNAVFEGLNNLEVIFRKDPQDPDSETKISRLVPHLKSLVHLRSVRIII